MRTSLLLSVSIVSSDGGGVNVTVQGDDLGDATDVLPDDPMQGTVNGVDRPTGVRYNTVVQALESAGFEAIDANAAGLYTVTYNYVDESSFAVKNVGGSIVEDVDGGIDELQGWTFTGNGFGVTVAGVATIAPALPA